MNIQRLCLAALLGASSTITLPAFAAAPLFASISLTDIEFKVVDLDLDDGITAGYTLLRNGGDTDETLVIHGFDYLSSIYESHPGPFIAASGSDSSSNGAIQWSVSPTALSASASITPAGGSFTPGQNSNAMVEVISRDSSQYSEAVNNIVLAPNTLLLITARATVSTGIDANLCPGCTDQDGQISVNVGASGALDTWGQELTPDGGFDPSHTQESNSTFGWGQYYDPVYTVGEPAVASATESGTLHVHLLNNSGNQLIGGLRASVSANVSGGAYALQTPEPGTYALVGLGLAAAGWQARRRKAARA